MEEAEHTYSWISGVVYLFNTMIGSGLLTLPKPFAEAGWVLGIAVLIIVTFTSYATATLILECLSVYTAITKQMKNFFSTQEKDDTKETNCTVIENKEVSFIEEPEKNDMKNNPCYNSTNTIQHDPKIFDITFKIEWTDLCRMFFNKYGLVFYYIIISLQLYAILTLFFVMVAKSLTSIVCTGLDWNIVNTTTHCSTSPSLTVMGIYYINLAAFICVICPFVYFDITATKLIQFVTFIYHILAILAMVVLPIMKISQSKATVSPKIADFSSLSNYFGASMFLMACHGSFPTIITSINDSKKMNQSSLLPFLGGVIVVGIFAICGAFAFDINEMQDMYTLNFPHPGFFKYFLELFPVISLASNLPVTAIVLSENLKKLFCKRPPTEYNVFVRRVLFPTLVVAPPIIVAYCTTDITTLVSYTGLFTGGALIFPIPVFLVYFSRKRAASMFGAYHNPHKSPFQHVFWLYGLMLWYILSLVVVIYYKIVDG